MNRRLPRPHRAPRVAAIASVALAVTAALPGRTFADKYWVSNDITGNWSNPSNWSFFLGGPGGAGAPAFENVWIRHTDALSRTAVLDASADVSQLFIGNSGGGTNTLSQTAPVNFTALGATVGLFGQGALGQSDGSNTFGSLALGFDPADAGTYTLSGTGALAVNQTGMSVGRAGTGTFNQSGGGSVTVGSTSMPTQLIVGHFPGGSGAYHFGGTGTLTNHGDEYIGFGGAGNFVQTGGMHAVGMFSNPRTLYLAHDAGSSGTFTLSGGLLNVSGAAYVGGSSSAGGGAGVLNISGTGAVLIAGPLTVWNTPGSAVNLSGGALTVPMINTNGDPSRFNWTAGTLNLTATPVFVGPGGAFGSALALGGSKSLSVGHQFSVNSGGSVSLGESASLTVGGDVIVASSGTATFTQTGGTHTIGDATAFRTFYIGHGSGASGSYSLDGGTLNVNADERIGYEGLAQFTHTGGTHAVGASNSLRTLRLGGNNASAKGTYSLSGSGELQVHGNLQIGDAGEGTFTQTDGSVNVIAVTSGNPTGGGALNIKSNSHYSLGGGSLSTRLSTIAGTFTHTAGTHTVVEAPTGAIFDLTLAFSSGSTASYALGGSGILAVEGDVGIGYGGNATFNHTSGTHTVGTPGAPRSLTIAGLASSTSSYSLSGSGTLAVTGNVNVGHTGAGTFTQTGGTHTIGSPSVNGNLLLGAAGPHTTPPTPGNGTYFLSNAGSLQIHGNAYIGGSDTTAGGSSSLHISGGSATLSGELKLWKGKGAVHLSGGTLSVGWINTDGAPQQFNWNGGIFRLTSSHLDLSSTGQLGAALDLTAGKVLDPVAGMNIAAGGTLSLQGGELIVSTLTNHGTFAHDSGVLTVNGLFTNSATATFAGTQNWGPASVFVNLAGTATFNAPLNNPGGFGPVVVVTGGSVDFNSSASLQRLQIGGGGAAAANLTSGSDKTLRVAILSLDTASGTKLDLSDNKLIVTGAAGNVGTANGSTYLGLSGLIQSGHNGGTWDGSGIVTSNADAAGGLTSLGIATAAQAGHAGGTFGGVSVSATDVLIMYTYAGDANLDGFVSGDDYTAIDFAIAVPGASGWANGDFNYDGIISGDDYTVIDFNIAAQGAPFPTGASAGGALTSVPEPAALVWLLSAGLLCPRRRRGARGVHAVRCRGEN